MRKLREVLCLPQVTLPVSDKAGTGLFLINLCTHLFISCDGSSLLHGLFSSDGWRELLFVVLCRLLTAVASFGHGAPGHVLW